MFDCRAIVRTFAQHDVEYAIVGGLAGVMQGAPIHTQDLDILYSLVAPNPERRLDAVSEPDAISRASNLIEVKKKLSRPKDQLAPCRFKQRSRSVNAAARAV